MRCKKCNQELLGYTSKYYPFESGFRCPQCDREWSDLQIGRAEAIIPNVLTFTGGKFVSDGIEFSFRKPLPEWEKEFKDKIVIANIGQGDEAVVEVLQGCGINASHELPQLLQKYFNAPTDEDLQQMKWRERENFAIKVKVKVKKGKIVIERIEE